MDPAVEVVEREMALLLRRAQGFSTRLANSLHPDLESPAYVLLVWLEDNGPARLTDVAHAFGVGKATLSRQLSQLEQLELVQREPDPHDGRAFRLALTGPASERVREIRAARRAQYRALLRTWPEEDVSTFGDLLGRMNALMEQVRPD
ncbi:MarR family winged helix-turn-helix transcriptional regulator [Spongisporangium articulatum]|uniref:MarR family winged helix-turn-helix transcriptional regulator n=1 Tax=Spongisporangium articulatum TaxID=3362603 RepID=A0ABW8AUF9_9ACTN